MISAQMQALSNGEENIRLKCRMQQSKNINAGAGDPRRRQECDRDRAQLSEPQNRWIRSQASSSSLVEVA